MAIESINSGVPSQVQAAATAPKPELDSTTIKAPNVPDSSSQAATAEESPRVEDAVDKLNEFTQNVAKRNLSFSVDKETNAFVVKVVDNETDEVIRQMPTEEALAVAKQIESMLGLILNDKA